jgi:hypothetical protein
MATVYKVKYPTGRTAYRMIIRRKGLPIFSLTFCKKKEAFDWVNTHEFLYFTDPEKYFDWAKQERLHQRRKRECLNQKK